MSVPVIMEGGPPGQPNRKDLNSAWRKEMHSFFEKAGLDGRLPAVVVAGSQSEAYLIFAKRVAKKDSRDFVVLLVDSEVSLLDQDVWATWQSDRATNGRSPRKLALMIVI